MKKILLTGGTGFIGRHFMQTTKDAETYILTRQKFNFKNTPSTIYIENYNELPEDIRFDVVINLAGENIAARPWTNKRKKELWGSRIKTTNALSHYLTATEQTPSCILQASAIGYYGVQQGSLTETSHPVDGFSHRLCEAWEKAADNFPIKPYVMRLAPVLSPNGGFLKNIYWPFKLGLGFHFWKSKAKFSWISMADVCGFMQYLIENQPAEKIYNLTSPGVVGHTDFYKSLSKALHRPNLLPLPEKLFNGILGDFGKELLTANFDVHPDHILQKTDYNFKHPHLADYLTHAYTK